MQFVENGTKELEVTVKLRCVYRPGQERCFSMFKYADTTSDVTQECDGKEVKVGRVSGCVGGNVEIATDKEAELPAAGETWMLTAEDLWNAFHDARAALGDLPPLVQAEWPATRNRMQVPIEEVSK